VRCDRFELLDDLEHLHFEHGTRQFVKPVVARLESNALPDLLDEVQIKLCLVVVQRIQEIWGRDDVRVEGRELRRVQSLPGVVFPSPVFSHERSLHVHHRWHLRSHVTWTVRVHHRVLVWHCWLRHLLLVGHLVLRYAPHWLLRTPHV
jgi:hypothetical protein